MVRALAIASVLASSLVVACSDPSGPKDPCAVQAKTASGSIELGLGSQFTPVTQGETVTMTLGIQGLWMFVINLRASDMDVGSAGREGALYLSAMSASGTDMSLESGCRAREFADDGSGNLDLAEVFQLPILPDYYPQLEGTTITIQVQVIDHNGRMATDDRTVVAHLPTH